jgi:hypothetical protein
MSNALAPLHDISPDFRLQPQDAGSMREKPRPQMSAAPCDG